MTTPMPTTGAGATGAAGAVAAEPFFDRRGDALAPRAHARSPWSPDMIAGRLLAGLTAAAVEDEHGGPDLQPARLTIDLFRSPPMVALEVKTSAARDGRRIRVVDAAITTRGITVARASVVLLRRSAQPEGQVWTAPGWSSPHPDEIEPTPPVPGRTPPPWDRRTVSGEIGTFGHKGMWVRDVSELVAGRPLSPFVRAAMAADLASPMANSGDSGLEFINADVTLLLRRLPLSEWIGIEVGNHLSEAGVAVAHCNVYDTEGAIGFSDVCALANPAMTPAASR